MSKPARRVRTGDRRQGSDGNPHRVVSKSIGADDSVTIAYNVHRPSGGIDLGIEVVAADAETDFITPADQARPDEFDAA